MIDIGAKGRESDGGVYAKSNIGYAIENNLLNIPPARTFDNYSDSVQFPYVFVADDAFTLRTHMMKPYARSGPMDYSMTIFNYRLSRARRIIENAFGILVARFQIFHKAIIASENQIVGIVQAAVALHNFLMDENDLEDSCAYCPVGFIDQEDRANVTYGEWRRETASGVHGLVPIRHGSNNYSKTAKETRDNFKNYFNSAEGSVPWQEEVVKRTLLPCDRR